MQIIKWPETCASLWYKETDNKQRPISIYLTYSKGWVNGVIVCLSLGQESKNIWGHFKQY